VVNFWVAPVKTGLATVNFRVVRVNSQGTGSKSWALEQVPAVFEQVLGVFEQVLTTPKQVLAISEQVLATFEQAPAAAKLHDAGNKKPRPVGRGFLSPHPALC